MSSSHASASTNLDSLLTVDHAQHDSTWLAKVIQVSFKDVYSRPGEVGKALDFAIRIGKEKDLENQMPKLYLIRGIAEDIKAQSDSALHFYHKGLVIAQELNDTTAEAGAYNNIGLIYLNRKNLDSALIFYQQSEKLFKQIDNAHGLMSTLNNMGTIYQTMNRIEPALRYFRQLLSKSKKEGSLYFESVAYTNISNIYHRINLHDSVLHYANRAIPIQIKENNLWGLAKSHIHAASAHEELNQIEKARDEYYQALEINHQLNDKKGLAAVYVYLGLNYRSAGDFEKYMEYMLQAKEYEAFYDEVKQKTDINQAIAWQQVRDYDQELYFELIRLSSITDSLHKAALDGKILDLQEAYEAEKKEQQITERTRELEEERFRNDKQLQIGLLLGIIALLIIGVLVAAYWHRQRIARLQQQQALANERTRISRDLHDHVGAHLTSIAMRIDMAGSEEGKKRKTQFLQIQDEAKQTIALLRDTIWAVNQQSFSLQEFAQKVEQYSHTVLPDMNIRVSHSNTSPTTLNSLVALNLFRVIQEALQNIMKHADANEVSIIFKVENKHLSLDIIDNGKGSSNLQLKDDHFGLENMRERIISIGGIIEFEPGELSGFSVAVQLPLK